MKKSNSTRLLEALTLAGHGPVMVPELPSPRIALTRAKPVSTEGKIKVDQASGLTTPSV